MCVCVLYNLYVNKNLLLLLIIVILVVIGLTFLQDNNRNNQSGGGRSPGLAIGPPTPSPVPESSFIPISIFTGPNPHLFSGEQYCNIYERTDPTGGTGFCTYTMTASSKYLGDLRGSNCTYKCHGLLASSSSNPGNCPKDCEPMSFSCPESLELTGYLQSDLVGNNLSAANAVDCQKQAKEKCGPQATLEFPLACVKS